MGLARIRGTLSGLGPFTRPAAAAIFIFVMYAVVAVHLPSGFLWIDRGLEYPLLWGVAALVFLICGGGPYAVDRAIGREF